MKTHIFLSFHWPWSKMMKNNNNNVEIEILSTKHGPDRPRVFFSGGGGDKTKTRLEEKLYKLEKEKKKTEK
jgi:hypothetical protein